MTFVEKLKLLTKDVNQTKVAKSAGLKANIFSTYVAKRTSIPRADIALKIARALKVPLDWLMDDEQDFPVPEPGKLAAGTLSDDELMEEAGRRYRLMVLRAESVVEKLSRVPWREVAKILYSARPGEKLHLDIMRAREALWLAYTMMVTSRGAYEGKTFADLRHSQMPGSGRPLAELDMEKIRGRFVELVRQQPEMQYVLDYGDLLTGVPFERGKTLADDKMKAIKAELGIRPEDGSVAGTGPA